MTDDNFFFRWVWRLNGLALLLLIALGIWSNSFWLLASLGLQKPLYPPGIVLPPGERQQPVTTNADLKLFLDYPRAGRDEAVLALAPPSPAGAYNGAPSESLLSVQYADMTRVANYLFVDANTGNVRWLFPTNDQTILNTDYMTAYDSKSTVIGPDGRVTPEHSGVDHPAVLVLYDVLPLAKAGTSSKYEVYGAKIGGVNLTKLLDNLDEVPIETIQGDRLHARYVSNGRPMLAVFSVSELKLIFKKDLTDLKPGSP